ncbi:hypothetical protein [uncultured Draconibacterium sp.]|uniref:hypothetical protein n=1 Tax=uncultured Draconibacterium sp. TaxID=1573823 RepID=UPI0029C765F6|nr:hypothetical protein [uncultured Draconibacterium sp.]
MFKDINDSQYRLKESNGGISLKNFIDGKVLPFTGFLYLSSFIFGTLFGRMVRIVRLDAFFKILRFKNYWFYLFNGQVTSFRKLKHHKEKNKKYLFTKADILIDTETSPLLYSGYVADYELQENDCKALSKVMLENAERYSMIGGKKTPVKIPGNFFVVDCTTLKNINLTYVYQEKTGTLKSKIPNYLDTAFALSYFLCIPFFIFRAERIEWDLYNSYFSLHWFHRIIAYLLFVQVLSLFNVFRRKGDEFQYVSISLVLAKIIIAAALGGVLYLLVK